MAELIIKPEYELYADAVIEQFQHEQIFLSPYSKILLRLCIEAWFEEPPVTKESLFRLPKSPDSSAANDRRELLGVLLARILDEVSREPHIEINKRREQAVTFVPLIYGIAESGRDVLQGWIQKN